MNSEQTGKEKRLSFQLTIYWGRLKGDKKLPIYQDVNPKVIDKLWPYCFVFKLVQELPEMVFTIEHIGDKLQTFSGNLKIGDMVNFNDSLVISLLLKKIAKKYHNSFEPILEEGEFTNRENKIVKFRACTLPFIDRQEKLKYYIVGVSWKIFD